VEANVDPSIPGSRLDADHPEKGVLFARRFTLNAGAFGAVPLEIAGDEELERYSGETVFVRVVNRDGIWFLGGATFDQPSHTPITGVAHSQRVELTILRGDEIGIT
jgi:hypothetical protein